MKRIGPLRFFKWTIHGLVNKTVEFRHMPPSRCAADAIDCVDFPAAFKAAIDIDPRILDAASAHEVESREPFHAAFRLPGLRIADRPNVNYRHLQGFLAPFGIDDRF